jgi:hypothetical protein
VNSCRYPVSSHRGRRHLHRVAEVVEVVVSADSAAGPASGSRRLGFDSPAVDDAGGKGGMTAADRSRSQHRLALDCLRLHRHRLVVLMLLLLPVAAAAADHQQQSPAAARHETPYPKN